jgi:hypothetical protein
MTGLELALNAQRQWMTLLLDVTDAEYALLLPAIAVPDPRGQLVRPFHKPQESY